MKKIIIRGAIVLVVLLVVGVIAVGFFLGDLVKAGMNTVGPKITQTTFVVNSVSVSMLTGSAGVKGLVIGNPEGYQSPHAISVGKAVVSVAPFSVLSDKIVVKSVEVRDAEITFDGNPFGSNNLKKLQDNVNALAGASGAPVTNASAKTGDKKPAKKLQVDDFLITGAKVHARINTGILNKEISLTLPDIHFSALGQGSEGITAADLTRKVLSQITRATVEELVKAVKDLSQDLGGLGTNAVKNVGDSVDKVKKSLGGLFGK